MCSEQHRVLEVQLVSVPELGGGCGPGLDAGLLSQARGQQAELRGQVTGGYAADRLTS